MPSCDGVAAMAQGKRYQGKERRMLGNAVIFLIIAIIAGMVVFSGVAGAASIIAEILFVLFFVLSIVSFMTGRRR
jgi:uncharacterized membrane protein YtjA (UPF0391 family)|tara:strand:- start:1597 stop:1821 length:225 start_codon:yes stop_codon:yes gene_type:complete